MHDSIDILMITYNRATYTRLSLARLLETCDESMRVWVWHNGEDRETLDVVESMRDHPRFHRFHHSPENKKLREPTNWFWQHAEGYFLSKVDDDCLVQPGWGQQLRHAHELDDRLGVIACCHFWPGDLDVSECANKTFPIGNGLSLLANCWVGGSAYVMRRECVEQNGHLHENETWTGYCIRLAQAGWRLGWLVPLVYQEHMDDPRSPHTLLRSDSDIERWLPLSAKNNGVTTVAQWQVQLTRSARLVQRASINPGNYSGLRRRVRSAWQKVRHLMGDKRQW